MALPLLYIALFAGLLGAPARALTTCPTSDTTWIGATSNYSICPGASFSGVEAAVWNKVASPEDCAQLCDKTPGCVRATHDAGATTCHLMDGTKTDQWVAQQGFSSIRFVSDWSLPPIVARCPVNSVNVTGSDGRVFALCPGTSYRGPSLASAVAVATGLDCMLLCYSTTGCEKAVYDQLLSTCILQDPSQPQFWTDSRRFATVYLVKPQNPSVVGAWSDLIGLPVIPVAVYVVPAFPAPTRLLAFSSWGKDTFNGDIGQTLFADYNFATGAVSERTVADTKHDMFCPGISQLADGRIVITGGDTAAAVSIYNPSSDTFTRAADMNIPRGYQSSTTTSDNNVFVIGGSWMGGRGNKTAERYDPDSNTWTLLPGASVDAILTNDNGGVYRSDNHAWLYAWTNGSVFQAGPSRQQHWLSARGSGSVTPAAVRDDADAMCGTNVMFDAGRIFSAGGSPSYEGTPATARAHITELGSPGSTPGSTVTRVADMSAPRAFANSVVLPDGRVLVVGGMRVAATFSDAGAVLAPELFDPATGKWAVMAEEAVARNYHSEALLLPDATVFSGGGGMCVDTETGCNLAANHADGQLFYPPYLFNADGSAATRPTIAALSTATVAVGGQLQVTMADTSPTNFALIRLGSATHSVNTDQRRIVPTVQAGSQPGTYTLGLPADSGILLRGYWYLFAISASGVPSMAMTVHVS